jgi:hypothetical protein
MKMLVARVARGLEVKPEAKRSYRSSYSFRARSDDEKIPTKPQSRYSNGTQQNNKNWCSNPHREVGTAAQWYGSTRIPWIRWGEMSPKSSETWFEKAQRSRAKLDSVRYARWMSKQSGIHVRGVVETTTSKTKTGEMRSRRKA